MRLRLVILGTPVLQLTTGADVLEDAVMTARLDRESQGPVDHGELSTLVERDPEPVERRAGFTPDLP